MADFLFAEWPAPHRVRTLVTTRRGGFSQAPYASLNLGDHVGDAQDAVAANRQQLEAHLPARPAWLSQVHGVKVVRGEDCCKEMPEADASVTRKPAVVCGVLTADCLPVLLCDRAGTVVAAAHAGWRGLLAGILENTVAAMAIPPGEILAWMGPAIGPAAFEVGEEVRQAFVAEEGGAAQAFLATDRPGKWMADLPGLARRRLDRCGLGGIYGGDRCTFSDATHFFSYRRDGVTGRQGAFIWLQDEIGAVGGVSL